MNGEGRAVSRKILVGVKDLMFGSKIHEAAKRSGTELSFAPRFERLRDVAKARSPEVLIVDLGEPGMLEELAAVKADAPSVRIIGFCGHVFESVMAAADKLGVDEVMTRGQFAARVEAELVRERGAA